MIARVFAEDWSEVERFLAARGYDEEEIARIVEIAQSQGLDAMLIDRVLATSERKEAGTVH